MSDRRAHFLIVVGDVFLAAAVGDIVVSVTLTDGRVVTGTPSARPARGDAAEEVDETGFCRAIYLDGERLALDDVIACTIQAPPN